MNIASPVSTGNPISHKYAHIKYNHNPHIPLTWSCIVYCQLWHTFSLSLHTQHALNLHRTHIFITVPFAILFLTFLLICHYDTGDTFFTFSFIEHTFLSLSHLQFFFFHFFWFVIIAQEIHFLLFLSQIHFFFFI